MTITGGRSRENDVLCVGGWFLCVGLKCNDTSKSVYRHDAPLRLPHHQQKDYITSSTLFQFGFSSASFKLLLKQSIIYLEKTKTLWIPHCYIYLATNTLYPCVTVFLSLKRDAATSPVKCCHRGIEILRMCVSVIVNSSVISSSPHLQLSSQRCHTTSRHRAART